MDELLTALRQSILYTERTYRLYLHYKGRIYDSHSEWARAVVRDAYEQADDEQRACLRAWFPWAFGEGEA